MRGEGAELAVSTYDRGLVMRKDIRIRIKEDLKGGV